jgi:intergrase/recombinase
LLVVVEVVEEVEVQEDFYLVIFKYPHNLIQFKLVLVDLMLQIVPLLQGHKEMEVLQLHLD